MLRLTKTLLSACIVAGLATIPACDDKKGDDNKADAKKDDAKKDDAKADDAKADDAKADDAKADDAKAEPPAGGDALVITAMHSPPKPTDPVILTVAGLTVVKAEFDPANIEGATAEIEIDMGSLGSDSSMRDNHLKSPDYLNVAEFPNAVVSVSDVKKAGEGYTATLVVKSMGKEVTWEATPFTVVESTDAAVKISLDKKFNRSDFGIGKSEGDSTAQELAAAVTLTLKKSG